MIYDGIVGIDSKSVIIYLFLIPAIIVNSSLMHIILNEMFGVLIF